MEAIGAASGVLTLVSFAYECSKVLYSTIDSFRNSQKILRELKAELGALGDVLKSLETIAQEKEATFSALRIPLFQCGSACKELDALLKNCTTHSDASKTSFRDWAKLQYKGKSLTEFKDMLARYKGTIAIAVGDVNVRLATVTLDVLNDYKRMISETTSDLREALEEINDRLSNSPHFLPKGDSTRQPLYEKAVEEKKTTELCISMCEEVSQHIEQVRPQVLARTTDPPTVKGDSYTQPDAPRLTGQSLRQCGENLNATTVYLRKRLADLDQLLTSPTEAGATERVGNHRGILEERESIERCLAVCSGADRQAQSDRVLVFEDVRLLDDGHQIIVSTIGDLISARRVSAGARSVQWLGQVSDTSLQVLSRGGRKDAQQILGEEDGTGTKQFDER